MQARHVFGERMAQFRQSEVLDVECVARIQRIDRRLPNERRRHFVRLAEPERQDAGAAHPCIRDFADRR